MRLPTPAEIRAELAGLRFAVVCSPGLHRPDRILARNLSADSAATLAARLAALERHRRPEAPAASRSLYWRQVDSPPLTFAGRQALLPL